MNKFKEKLKERLIKKYAKLTAKKDKTKTAIDGINITNNVEKQAYINSLKFNEYINNMEKYKKVLDTTIGQTDNLDVLVNLRKEITDYYLRYFNYFDSLEKEIKIINVQHTTFGLGSI